MKHYEQTTIQTHTPRLQIVHDHLWYKISKGKTNILPCPDCMEQRLNKQLTGNDLKPCRITQEFKLGHEL